MLSVYLSMVISHPIRESFNNFIKSLFDDLSMRGWNLTCLAKVIEIFGGNPLGNPEFIRANDRAFF